MNRNGFDLAAAAYQEMIKDGFHPDFPDGTRQQLDQIRHSLETEAGAPLPPGTHDLRDLLWSSKDNDPPRALDQVEWAESLPPNDPNASIRVRVGVADVASAVQRGTPIDQHA